MVFQHISFGKGVVGFLDCWILLVFSSGCWIWFCLDLDLLFFRIWIFYFVIHSEYKDVSEEDGFLLFSINDPSLSTNGKLASINDLFECDTRRIQAIIFCLVYRQFKKSIVLKRRKRAFYSKQVTKN